MPAAATKERVHWVYVIELKRAVVGERRFREENPDRVPGRACYYVGQSVREPAVRYRQHREGHRSSRWVERYGQGLVTELCRRRCGGRDAALGEEERLAEELRARGHGVWYR